MKTTNEDNKVEKSATDLIDNFLSSMGSRDLIRTTEVADALLDIRNCVVDAIIGLDYVAALWMKVAMENDYYREKFGDVEIPDDWTNKRLLHLDVAMALLESTPVVD